MSHISSFLTPHYFKSETLHPHPGSATTARTTSDIENHVPQCTRPSSGQTSTADRKILGALSIPDVSGLTSACSLPDFDYNDPCASTRPIIALTPSPKWQLQFGLLRHNRPFQGLDMALSSSESLWSPANDIQNSDIRIQHPTHISFPNNSSKHSIHQGKTDHLIQRHSKSHWFHRFNIFQKFRRAKDDQLKRDEDNSVQTDVLTCYNEFKTTDIDQRLTKLRYLSQFDTAKSRQWGYLVEDSEIPPFPPLHELNEKQLEKLKYDLLEFSELDSSSEDHDLTNRLAQYDLRLAQSCSDPDISTDDDVKQEENQDHDDNHIQQKQKQQQVMDEHNPETDISAMSTAPASALLPKSIQESEVSSPSFATDQILSSGSIQSSHELILEHTRSRRFMESNFPSGHSSLRTFSAFEQVDSLHSLHRGVVHENLPVHDEEEEDQETEALEHQPLPCSSIYSPVISETLCTRGNFLGTHQYPIDLSSDTEHTSRSIVPVFDNTVYATSHRYRLLSGCVVDASVMDVAGSLLSREIDSSERGIAIRFSLPRVQGISTCPPRVDLEQGHEENFPVRMNSLLIQLKGMKITSGALIPEDSPDVY